MAQKLAVAFPIYSSVPTAFFFRWLRVDQRHVSRFIGVDYTEITIAASMIVDEALQSDNWDRLVIFEGDMIVPLDALTQIATRHTPEQPIVGSVYFQHMPPHYPVAYVEYEGSYRTLSSGTVQEWCAKPAMYQVDAIGFGLTSIARHVLENWPAGVPMFTTDAHYRSHDLWFCNEAKKQGHHIFLDTALVCDHLTPVPIGAADNLKYSDGEGKLADFSFAGNGGNGTGNGTDNGNGGEPAALPSPNAPRWATYAPE